MIENNEKEVGNLPAKVVNMFLDSNARSVNMFCSTPSLKPQAFYRCVEYIKIHNQELYKRYVMKVCNIKEEKYDVIINEVNKVMMLIKTRPFDVLDYFLTTGLSPHIFVNIAKVIYDSSDMMPVKKLFGNIINNPVLINKSIAINGKLILKDYFANGDDYEVPKEPKEQTITFLENLHIPLYQSVYSVALKRYLKKDPIFYGEAQAENIENGYIRQ